MSAFAKIKFSVSAGNGNARQCGDQVKFKVINYSERHNTLQTVISSKGVFSAVKRSAVYIQQAEIGTDFHGFLEGAFPVLYLGNRSRKGSSVDGYTSARSRNAISVCENTLKDVIRNKFAFGSINTTCGKNKTVHYGTDFGRNSGVFFSVRNEIHRISRCYINSVCIYLFGIARTDTAQILS